VVIKQTFRVIFIFLVAFIGVGCSAKVAPAEPVRAPEIIRVPEIIKVPEIIRVPAECNCTKGTVTNKTIKRTNISIEDNPDCNSDLIHGGSYKSILSN
jgi:hypothetical protein